ncbi:izumo sperm-egg fusion protein 3-like [Mauremys mutica]|uniref:izumo sperm-egg fusion protein 3-like n=1 Tax=Mauremys mutica TaxID=74926 RepID=UPI001D16571A|nr:izumo sperm-egg fusion protein 3-like [Mauremys mutica]
MRSQRGRGSVAMSCSLLLLLLLLRPRGAGSCLHCDRPFLRGLGVLLGEAVPSEVPNRDALIQRQVEAFERLYSTHLPEKHHRVLDVRRMLAVKAALSGWLRALKETPWKGVHLLQLTLAQHRESLRTRLREALESFADVACSEDCSECGPPAPTHNPLPGGVSLGVPDLVPPFHIPAVSEGPVLDCWTCLRINAQCFDGELCGEEDPRDAERKEITLYLFLVCQSVLLASAALLYCVCCRHRRWLEDRAWAGPGTWLC